MGEHPRRRADEIAALHNGALDVGSGVRAAVRGGVVTFARTPPIR